MSETAMSESADSADIEADLATYSLRIADALRTPPGDAAAAGWQLTLARQWELRTLQALQAGNGAPVPSQLLAIPPALSRMRYESATPEKWARLARHYADRCMRVPQTGDDRALQETAEELLSAVCCQALVAGLEGAITGCTAQMLALLPRVTDLRMYRTCGSLLSSHGWFQAIDRKVLHTIAEAVDWPAVLGQRAAGTICQSILAGLGFDKWSPRPWTEAVFETLALPWLLHAAEHGHDDAALMLENVIYQDFVEQIESDAHYRQCFLRWRDAMHRCGQRAAAPLPDLAAPGGELRHLGIFAHNLVALGHIDALVDLLHGLAGRDLRITIYVLGIVSEPLRERIAPLGIDIECDFYARADSMSGGLKALRRKAAEQAVDCMLWVCTPAVLIYASALRLAPVQIWWSLKFHFMSLDSLDGYLTHGGLFRRFREEHGQRWHVIPLTHDDLLPEASAEKARSVRNALHQRGVQVILGTLARTTKLRDPEYLQAVATILAENPDAVFLWAGETEPPDVVRFFDDRGVGDRCIHIGWSDTAVFAQVFDVFLDTFPQPCARTALQALAAGCPVVSREGRAPAKLYNALEALRGETGSEEDRRELGAIFGNGENPCALLSVAATAEGYVAWANRLIADTALRRRTGEAGRRYCQRYFGDTQAMASAMLAVTREIVADTAARRLASRPSSTAVAGASG